MLLLLRMPPSLYLFVLFQLMLSMLPFFLVFSILFLLYFSFSSSPMHFLYIQPLFLIPLPLLLRPSFACCPPSVCPILFLFIFLSFLLLTLASPSTSIRKPYRVRAMTDHPTPTVEGIYWRSIYVTRSFKYPRRSWQHAVPWICMYTRLDTHRYIYMCVSV